MNEALSYLAFSILGLLAIHAGIVHTVKTRAEQNIRALLGSKGAIHLHIAPNGFWGWEQNRLREVDISASHVSLLTIPLQLYPHSGWRGDIDSMSLHLRRFTLQNLPVHSLIITIPHLTYDAGRAVLHGELQLRSAGTGTASIAIGANGLKEFILHKYPSRFENLHVQILSGKIALTGSINLIGEYVPIRSYYQLNVQDGRYVYLVSPEIELNGSPTPSSLSASIVHSINPVLDLVKDLSLGGYFELKSVSIQTGRVLFHGLAFIPSHSLILNKGRVHE